MTTGTPEASPATAAVRTSSAAPGRPTKAECLQRASAILARASAEIAWLWAEHGRDAIAAQEFEPGHDRVAAADQYGALHARAMRQRAGAALPTGQAASR